MATEDPLAALDHEERQALAQLAQAQADGTMTRRQWLKLGAALGVGGLVGGGGAAALTGDAQAADTGTAQVGAPGNAADVYLDRLLDDGGDAVLDVDDTGAIAGQNGRTWDFPAVQAGELNNTRQVPAFGTFQAAVNDLPSGGGVIYLTDFITESGILIDKPVTVIAGNREANNVNPPVGIDANGGDGIDIQTSQPCQFYGVHVTNFGSTYGWRIGPSSGEGVQNLECIACGASRGSGHGVRITNGNVYGRLDFRVDRADKHGLFVDVGGEAWNGNTVRLQSTNCGLDALHLGTPSGGSTIQGNTWDVSLEGPDEWGLFVEDDATFRGNSFTGYGIENPNQASVGAGGIHAQPTTAKANLFWFYQLETGALSSPLADVNMAGSMFVSDQTGITFTGPIGVQDQVGTSSVFERMANLGKSGDLDSGGSTTLSDDATVTLISNMDFGKVGSLWVRNASDNEAAKFSVAGTNVSVAESFGSWAASDTDGNACLFVNANNELVLKNRLGASKAFQATHLGTAN